jgi:DNA polymerase-4
MKTLLCVRIDRFYTRALESRDHTLRDRPFVVHRDKVVLDANLVALDKGIRVGMKLSEAKMLGEGGAFVRYLAEDFTSAQHDWLTTCAKFVDGLEPLEGHLALMDLSSHPDPRSIAEVLLTVLPESFVGAGPSRWLAMAAANETGPGQRLVDATVNPVAFAHNIPVAELPMLSPETRDRLIFYGYESLGRVANVPHHELRRLFQSEAEILQRMIQGQGEAQVDPVFPPHSVVVRLPFDGSVEDLTVIDQGLVRLSEELSERLTAEDRVGKTLELLVEYESARPLTLHRTFNRGMQSPASLYTALVLLSRDMVPGSVVSLRVRMPETIRATRTQSAFGAYLDQRFRDQAVKVALDRVKTAYGEESVRQGSEVEIPRRKRVLRAYQDGLGWS